MIRIPFFAGLCFLLQFPALAFAQESENFNIPPSEQPVEIQSSSPSTSSSPDVRFAIEGETMIPLWLGPQVKILFHDQLQFYFGKGIVPKSYTDFIGRTVANLTNRPENEDLIQAAFDSTDTWLMGLDFKFSKESGFVLGAAYQKLKSSGSTDLKTVGDATGVDLTTVNDLLLAFGLSNQLTLDSDLDVGWLYGGYTWMTNEHFSVSLVGGVAKVLRARETLHTGIAEFDSTQIGETLRDLADDKVESVIQRDAITPLLGLNLRYEF